MDRRSFLLHSAAFAVGPTTLDAVAAVPQAPPQAEHPMAPPVAVASTTDNRSPFVWQAGGLRLHFNFYGDRLRFPLLLPQGVPEPASLPVSSELSDLETSLHCTGEDIPDHHGQKLTAGSPGIRLNFIRKDEVVTPKGSRLTLIHEDPVLRLRVQSMYDSFRDVPVLRRKTTITNLSQQPIGLEYVSSAMLHNFASPDTFQDDLRIHFAYNSWQAEAQWRTVRPAEIGLVQNGNFSVSGALFSTMGSWPCQTFLPMMMVQNTASGITWFWQIEHNGSWHCEIAQNASKALYAYLGGPDAQHAQAWKQLRPGETYETVPVAIGCVHGGFEAGVRELTRYRRAILEHPRSDTGQCPVIFNDVVMLNGDQTAANELPLIDAAAEAGCEVFCMDAGWSARPGENWWGAVGDWVSNATRFPRGLKQVTEYIRGKGMVAGLWIEPEVAGLDSALAKSPDSWFFLRHGKRVVDHSRYHLDFRNPEVRAYTDGVFHRLIDDYGVGYIKLDYNINALEGTESGAESFGQGLLGHNRAFLAWMDALLDRYPYLTLETVASGSMRMEYSMLSRAQLQSISDADDYRLYASLTTGCSAAVLPEQMGIWSQPLAHDTPEAASCNMINAMLGRIHQSGFLPVLSPASKAQVRKGIATYKQHIRPHIPHSIPFYPLGMPDLTQATQPAALGMEAPGRSFVAVWRRNGPEQVFLPSRSNSLQLLYPSDLGIRLSPAQDGLSLRFPHPYMGCILST